MWGFEWLVLLHGALHLGQVSSLSPAIATIAGTPEVVAGPSCCMFDSPYMAIKSGDGVVRGYTANQISYVLSRGSTISDVLPNPTSTGLGRDTSNTSYSHCGKWLNAAWVDSTDHHTVHGYFHQVLVA